MAKFFAVGGNGKLINNFKVVVDPGARHRDLTTNKMVFDDSGMLVLEFEHGSIIVEDELSIEFCEKYNVGGKLSNGRVLKASDFPLITKTAPGTAEVKEVIKEVVVEKNVIPKAMFKTMEFEAIVEMARDAFKVELESKDSKSAIKELEKLGFVK